MSVASMLQLDDICVAYPAAGQTRVVLDGLSLVLARGQVGCLLGASGCGKTTVLRAVAGFEPLRGGRVLLDDVLLSRAGASVPPEQRGVGMMFQDYALFPHLSVAGNVAYGLLRSSRATRDARVLEMLELVGLADRAGAYPHELSGGQQQRVALARALAPAPKLLLLDEPFSNLDADSRARLASELRRILSQTGTTALLVTHDQAEAFAMADVIGVMDDGRLLQWADAGTLYRQPAHRHVAAFVGRGGLVPAAQLALDGDDEVLVRPHQWMPVTEGGLHGEVLAVEFRGPNAVAHVALASGARVEVDLPASTVKVGQVIALRFTEHDPPRFPRVRA